MRLYPALGALFLVSISTAIDDQNTNPASSLSILRRNAEIETRLADEPVHGVRKMSTDEGEKFFLDYWHFGDTAQGGLAERDLAEINATASDDAKNQKGSLRDTGTGISPAQLLARSYAFSPSFDPESRLRGSLLKARDFKCPGGTTACTSINLSDRCCSTGDTCVIVTDTGSGDVGCCPNGQTCSGTIGSCQSGYTTCSTALGGGCCIPGYECVEGGCAYISVVTVTIHSTVTVSTVTHTTSQQISHSTSSSTSTRSTSSTSSTKSTSTESLTPPARGTSITTTTHSATTRIDVCPTGFYACSAVYNGGCCQTNRDCDTTSCPTTSSTTFTSDGKTIVIPVTTASSGSSRTAGKCPGGWFSCADTAGDDCCPSGYACGASICTATGSVATTVAKEAPTSNGAGVERVSGVVLGVGLAGWAWIL
ncbi:putative GPI anchored protein [Penicillium brasilianum]|uniref:Putative GPI anchored protein n=1 Tax=Penicillium brasilianum TaxID=104259 RepID=A0A1S9RI94_PENBI|nr:putative GPI anchored protein [Penicillium brasilianum]